MAIAANPTRQVNSAAVTKDSRARDAAQAMREYEAQRVAVLAKTARLRALRLAKEAEEAANEAAKPAPKRVRAPKKAS